MRRVWVLSSVFCLLALGGRAAAQDEARAVIEKAIQASGGPAQLAKLKAVRATSKGEIESMGLNGTYTADSLNQKGQMKFAMELEISGQKVAVTQIWNKDKGWIQVNAGGTMMTIDIKDELAEAMKEAVHHQGIERLTPLLEDKAYTLSFLGEVKVRGKSALGVKVSSKDHKEVNLYFDKESGLLAKRDGTGLGPDQKEANQEIFYSEYKEFDGLKQPTKLEVHSDGKKFMTSEVSEYKFVDKFDDSEFDKP